MFECLFGKRKVADVMGKSKGEPLRNVIGSDGKTNGAIRAKLRRFVGRVTGRKAKNITAG